MTFYPPYGAYKHNGGVTMTPSSECIYSYVSLTYNNIYRTVYAKSKEREFSNVKKKKKKNEKESLGCVLISKFKIRACDAFFFLIYASSSSCIGTFLYAAADNNKREKCEIRTRTSYPSPLSSIPSLIPTPARIYIQPAII